MKYQPPYGSIDPNASYADRNTPGVTAGSVPPAAAIEQPMREIVNVLTDRGLVPDAADLSQLAKALRWGTNGRDDLAVNGWRATPPASPALGSRYVVAEAATGAWFEKVGKIAIWAGAWIFIDPVAGLQANTMVGPEYSILYFDGSAWQAANFIRRLTGDITFYVRGDGNDANDGGANTPERAFKTLQGAYEAVRAKYYANGNLVTLQLGSAGTYAGLNHTTWPGTIYVRGDPANRTSYNITQVPGVPSDGPCFFSAKTLIIEGVRVNPGLLGIATARCVQASAAGLMTLINVDLIASSTTLPLISAESASRVTLLGAINLFNNAGSFANLQSSSVLNLGDVTGACNLFVNSQNFSDAFIVVISNSYFEKRQGGPSGPAAGARYRVAMNGVINTAGSGENFFPGNAVGIKDTGGQYV